MSNVSKVSLSPVCHLLGRLSDGSVVLVMSFRRYKPESGWLLAIEYQYTAAYKRFVFFNREGGLVSGAHRLRSLAFSSAEEACEFFNEWLNSRKLSLEGLDIFAVEKAASNGSDPKRSGVRRAGVGVLGRVHKR